jgi:hypothetical protein
MTKQSFGPFVFFFLFVRLYTDHHHHDKRQMVWMTIQLRGATVTWIENANSAGPAGTKRKATENVGNGKRQKV